MQQWYGIHHDKIKLKIESKIYERVFYFNYVFQHNCTDNTVYCIMNNCIVYNWTLRTL